MINHQIKATSFCEAYRSKGLKGFAAKRLAVILIPFTVCNLIKIPVVLLTGLGLGWKEALCNFLVFDISFDTSMWYVQYILICYILFYLIFSRKHISKKNKAILFFMTGLAAAIIMAVLMNHPYSNIYNYPVTESFSHHLSFPLGIAFCFVYDGFQKLSAKSYIVISMVGLILYLLCSLGIPITLFYYLANLSFLLFIIPLAAFLKRLGLYSSLLNRLGRLAYYIYLNEMIVMNVIVYKTNLRAPVQVLLIFLCSILLAVPMKIISEWILKLIGKKCNAF